MLISLYFQGRRAGIYYYFILYRPPRPVKEQGHPLYVYFPKFHHMSSLLSVGGCSMYIYCFRFRGRAMRAPTGQVPFCRLWVWIRVIVITAGQNP